MTGEAISHYHVLDKIGEGGMGVVYKAEDTLLDRTVALKFLSAHLLEDEEARERFVREAKAAATLDHPNICTVYEIDEAEGQTFLAMAFIDGPTLQQKIDERPLKLKQAVEIAIQIADGLATAHQRGINHRDIKPANVMLTADGQAKIMDFGLAQLGGQTKITKSGMMLGTPSYMAPEQIRAEETDHRVDIWAFGVVLHEMIAGQPPFSAETEQGLGQAVLHLEPEPLTALRRGVPMELDRIVAKCLAKDPEERYQHIDETLVDLRALRKRLPETTRSAATAATPAPAARPSRLPWVVAAALAICLVIIVVLWVRERPLPQAVVRFSIPLAEGLDFSNTGRRILDISPDGTRIVHTANAGLWVRALDQWEDTLLVPGTVGSAALNPFFSPDGQWVAFFADGELKRVPVAGGTPISLCRLTLLPFGASWGADETILYGQGSEGIWRVPASGGATEQVIAVAEGELAAGPQMLPGGEWVLFTLRPQGSENWNQAQVVAQSLKTGERMVLVDGGHDARYLTSGRLVYVRNNVLMAVPFDPDTRRVTGEAREGVSGVRDAVTQMMGNAVTGSAQFAVASNGTLIYVTTEPQAQPGRLIWLNREGVKTSEIGQTGGQARDFALSPDEQSVAYWEAARPADWDIWVLNLSRGDRTKISDSERQESRPNWSPDGRSLVVTSTQEGQSVVFFRRADGSEQAVPLTDGGVYEADSDWSSDGKYILYDHESSDPGTGSDLWYLERNADGSHWEPHEYLAAPDNEWVAKLSPDGRYAAYVSNESGQNQVYVRPFPDGGQRWTVSTTGGVQPRWSRDSGELFYVDESGTMMSVAVSTSGEFQASAPQGLFPYPELLVGLQYPRYDVSHDGKRFLTMETGGGETGQAPPAIQVVLNWLNELPNTR